MRFWRWSLVSILLVILGWGYDVLSWSKCWCLVDASSRFWRWNLIKICVRTSDITLRIYFGKQNSTLGSIVPLAMFLNKALRSYSVGELVFSGRLAQMVWCPVPPNGCVGRSRTPFFSALLFLAGGTRTKCSDPCSRCPLRSQSLTCRTCAALARKVFRAENPVQTRFWQMALL